MTRARIISVLVGLSLVALIAWVANHTSWEDTRVPMPPKGEALTNPFYAVQRFAETLGAHTAWDRVLAPPPPSSVIVLSAWHWNLSSGRREALERWVESGGRLVIDQTLAGGESEFERWSGIVRGYRDLDRTREFRQRRSISYASSTACLSSRRGGALCGLSAMCRAFKRSASRWVEAA